MTVEKDNTAYQLTPLQTVAAALAATTEGFKQAERMKIAAEG
jgi:hypothetical protein